MAARPARTVILGRRCEHAGGLIIPCTEFSQRKKAWDTIEALDPEFMATARIVDDVSGAKAEANRSRLDKLLSKSGRAHIIDAEGKVIYLLVECEENVMRGPDYDEDGDLIYNPARK